MAKEEFDRVRIWDMAIPWMDSKGLGLTCVGSA